MIIADHLPRRTLSKGLKNDEKVPERACFFHRLQMHFLEKRLQIIPMKSQSQSQWNPNERQSWPWCKSKRGSGGKGHAPGTKRVQVRGLIGVTWHWGCIRSEDESVRKMLFRYPTARSRNFNTFGDPHYRLDLKTRVFKLLKTRVFDLWLMCTYPKGTQLAM